MHIFFIFVFIIFATTITNAQENCRGIDTVYSFTPGNGQNIGQGDEYFPENIFGFPSVKATFQIPEQSPEEILSLGFDGEIIVGFKDYVIEDKEGIDFIIFENAFENPVNQKIFAEPAKVSVSSDGVNYIDFPFDLTTLIGCAGISPTIGGTSPCDASVSGGDGFDLANIGVNHISHIKITDISQMVKSDPWHPFYDPIISGFDLDAVVGIHLIETTLDTPSYNIEKKYSLKMIDQNYYFLSIFDVEIAEIVVYNIQGSTILSKSFNKYIIIDLSNIAKGIYFLHISIYDDIFTEKLLVY